MGPSTTVTSATATSLSFTVPALPPAVYSPSLLLDGLRRALFVRGPGNGLRICKEVYDCAFTGLSYALPTVTTYNLPVITAITAGARPTAGGNPITITGTSRRDCGR
jgi:hypothetical protein